MFKIQKNFLKENNVDFAFDGEKLKFIISKERKKFRQKFLNK